MQYTLSYYYRYHGQFGWTRVERLVDIDDVQKAIIAELLRCPELRNVLIWNIALLGERYTPCSGFIPTVQDKSHRKKTNSWKPKTYGAKLETRTK